MAEPTLVDALAAGVLGVALFCAARLVMGAVWRRPVERDVDVTHVVMGVSMAGMLTGRLSGNWNLLWLVTFGASGCWFAWRVHQETTQQRRGMQDMPSTRDAPHPHGAHVHHIVASVAMLYMIVALRWLAPAAGHALAGGMAGMAGGAHDGTPLLAFAVAGLIVLDASVFATRVLRSPSLAVAGPSADRSPAGAGGPSSSLEQKRIAPCALAPRGTAACTLVMSLAMAYMFVTMHL